MNHMIIRSALVASLLTFAAATTSQAMPAERAQSCTPTITQAEMNNWNASYANTVHPSDTAQQAYNAWYASGPARTVPELACLSRAQLAQVYNVIAQTTWLDPSDQFDSSPATLNFFNDLVATGGSAYQVYPARIFYNNGANLKSGTFTG